MKLSLVPAQDTVQVLDTVAESGVQPEIVGRGRGAYLDPRVAAWENLQMLAARRGCTEWSEHTVWGFIDTARVLIGCCVGGDEIITRAKFFEIGNAAKARAREIAILRNSERH